MSEIADLAAAYAAGYVPNVWTPAHVVIRLTEAFSVLHRTSMRIGPKLPGNNWIQIVQLVEEDELFAELAKTDIEVAMDYRARQDEQDAMIAARSEQQREEADRQVMVPTALEASKADEAIGWCLSYLEGEPVMADALQLYCKCAAINASAAAALRRRCEIADDLVEQRRAEIKIEARRDKEIARALRERTEAVDPKVAVRQTGDDEKRARMRREVLSDVIEWAKGRIIRHDDVVVEAKGRLKECGADRKVRVRRQDLIPNRVFTRRWMDVKRKEGAAAIAKALNRDRVVVR